MNAARRLDEIEQQLAGVPRCGACGNPLREEDRRRETPRVVIFIDEPVTGPDFCPECGAQLVIRIAFDIGDREVREELPLE